MLPLVITGVQCPGWWWSSCRVEPRASHMLAQGLTAQPHPGSPCVFFQIRSLPARVHEASLVAWPLLIFNPRHVDDNTFPVFWPCARSPGPLCGGLRAPVAQISVIALFSYRAIQV